MAVIYALLIMKGLKTFSQVPVKLQEEVKAYLYSMDLDENGYPLPVPVITPDPTEEVTEEEPTPIITLPTEQ